MKQRKAEYKIKCCNDGLVFDTIDELCTHYGLTYDQVAYRLDKGNIYQDGRYYERVYDNTEALESTKTVDSKPFVDKYGDKEVPVPGYEDRYTISTSGVIRDMKHGGKVMKIKSKTIVKNKVILYKPNQPQVHDVENLLKKAFGDPTKD